LVDRFKGKFSVKIPRRSTTRADVSPPVKKTNATVGDTGDLATNNLTFERSSQGTARFHGEKTALQVVKTKL